MHYAQLQNNTVICLSNLSGEVIADNMIQLQGDYPQIIGNKYENGTFKKIKLDNQSTTLNTPINIPIKYQTFDLEAGEHITDTSINKDVEVYVNDVLQGSETILNGVGNIEFESAEPGTFKITVENYSCEVIVE